MGGSRHLKEQHAKQNLKMGVQYAVILVLATIFYQAETACVSDQHINGCSVPIKGNFPYETRFLPACNRHDVCYLWHSIQLDEKGVRPRIPARHAADLSRPLQREVWADQQNQAQSLQRSSQDVLQGGRSVRRDKIQEGRPPLVHCRQVCGRKRKAKDVKMRTVEYVTLVRNVSKH